MNRLVIKTILPKICLGSSGRLQALTYSPHTVTCESKQTLPVETVVLEICSTFSVMMGK